MLPFYAEVERSECHLWSRADITIDSFLHFLVVSYLLHCSDFLDRHGRRESSYGFLCGWQDRYYHGSWFRCADVQPEGYLGTLLIVQEGINYCFAKILLREQCNVVIADLGLRPEAQKLVDEYTSNPRAIFVKTDVVNWDQLTNVFDVTEKEFGGADIVRIVDS